MINKKNMYFMVIIVFLLGSSSLLAHTIFQSKAKADAACKKIGLENSMGGNCCFVSDGAPYLAGSFKALPCTVLYNLSRQGNE